MHRHDANNQHPHTKPTMGSTATPSRNPKQKTTPKSCHQRQHHTTKHHRMWLLSLRSKSTAEAKAHANTLQRNQTLVHLTQEHRYKLRINTTKTPFQNAITNIENTPTSQYFSKSKTAFHDLTVGKIVPPLAKAVLGLGMKFICTPNLTTGDISAST
jgi:hypothetical protein